MSIKTKIMLPMIVISIIIAAAVLVSNIVLFNDYVNLSTADSVNASAILANDHIESLKREASLAGKLAAEQTDFIQAVVAQDRDTLISLGQGMQSDTGVEFVTVTDAAGVAIARSHEPENYGDSVANQDNIIAALAGNVISVIEPGTAVVMSVRSGSPVYDEAGTLVGVVSVGFRLDTNDFVDRMKGMTANETTVFLGDTRISTTVINPDGSRAIGTKADTKVTDVVMNGDTYFGEAMILGRAVLGDYMPLKGASGDVIGMMFSGKYLDVADETIFGFIRTGVIIVVALLAVTVLLILYITRRIVAPIYVMSKAAIEMAEGNTNVDVKIETRDEMRVLGDAFERMIVDTRKQVDAIESIAKGDLTVTVKARSEKDVMNHALINMLKLNNSVFSNIASAANQVSLGSQHIADSSQNLAQGATEQAATVEELSASIAEISDKTKTSANMAGEAAKLADTIKENAENGSRQMDEMISAVKAINDSSHDISRVIKVIDDIAFQTNILALNAAVEAARAGQHGKGFTVVADEVRSLASKSAEAAKNTGAMIQDSIGKAELGSRIASETAESLSAIISGIQESDRLISEIAISSQEQALSISQVNDGVDQVAQVVQQNSATAEENAAASEEMSSQSSVLRQMISKFSLADSGGGSDASDLGVTLPVPPSPFEAGGSDSGFSLSGNADSKY